MQLIKFVLKNVFTLYKMFFHAEAHFVGTFYPFRKIQSLLSQNSIFYSFIAFRKQGIFHYFFIGV